MAASISMEQTGGNYFGTINDMPSKRPGKLGLDSIADESIFPAAPEDHNASALK
jgi:hypothetical protein